MATPAEHRAALVGLTRLARRDLFALWASLEGLGAAKTREALRDLLPVLGDRYGAAAATLAADWFDDLRDAADVRGAFRADPAGDVGQDRWDALARYGVGPLFDADPDRAAALLRLEGGVQRTVADRHRLTIVENSIRDPRAVGWRRVGVGSNCGFCRMLIDRGHVYTEASVTFRSHDHCNCAASPSWDDTAVKVTGEPYRQSQASRSDATKRRDNERAYDYIRDNYGADAL